VRRVHTYVRVCSRVPTYAYAQQHAELRIRSDSRWLRPCALMPCGFRDSVRHVDLRPVRTGAALHAAVPAVRNTKGPSSRSARRKGSTDVAGAGGAGRLLCDRLLLLGCCFASRYVVMKGTIQVSRLGSASEHMQQEEGEVPKSTRN
jgi:hypothetical protein